MQRNSKRTKTENQETEAEDENTGAVSCATTLRLGSVVADRFRFTRKRQNALPAAPSRVPAKRASCLVPRGDYL
uniref:Uncharacterized protein n=1 Tax=Oryza sativa subsp. japonica TaxID=39947 RepID=Q6K491_ORYSJ|nr:hypothetical protein [Oryza sativa Japonica Group]BAD22278.1 hypothetical protein [Oryza sativa Japonica Group]